MYVQQLLSLILMLSLMLFSAQVYSEDEEAETEAAAESNSSYYKNLDPSFTVNYGGTGRLRYLKTDISLRVSRKGSDAIDLHDLAIRHIIVMMLSRQMDENISSSQGREMIRQGILSEIQNFMKEETGEKYVTDVLFNSFVVQK